MKKKNSICEFNDQRNLVLLENFRASLARQSEISIKRAFGDAATAPAPRFWVSERRALTVVKKMLAGNDATLPMRKEKREMFRLIYRRVVEEMEKNPTASLSDIVFDVVNSEAPSSFIDPEYAGKLITAARKTRRINLKTPLQ